MTIKNDKQERFIQPTLGGFLVMENGRHRYTDEVNVDGTTYTAADEPNFKQLNPTYDFRGQTTDINWKHYAVKKGTQVLEDGTLVIADKVPKEVREKKQEPVILKIDAPEYASTRTEIEKRYALERKREDGGKDYTQVLAEMKQRSTRRRLAEDLGKKVEEKSLRSRQHEKTEHAIPYEWDLRPSPGQRPGTGLVSKFLDNGKRYKFPDGAS